MQEVCFPNSYDFENLSLFSQKVAKLSTEDDTLFKVGFQPFVTPVLMIFLLKTLISFRRRCNCKVSYEGLSHWEYANNLGFSHNLKLADDPYPQRAYGSDSYIPITVLRRDEIEKDARKNLIEFGDSIQNKCNEIAPIVSRGLSSEFTKLLSDLFREIMRNTFEHAERESLVFCAQYWPKMNRVDFCLSDAGIGLSKSIKKNPKISAMSDRESIYYCLMPGVSSTGWRKKRASQRSDWDNAGFGLFLCHQIFGKYGKFHIASGDSALLIEDGLPARDADCSVKGVLINLTLQLDRIPEIFSMLQEVRKLAADTKEKYGVKSLSIVDAENFLKQKQT